MWFCIPSMKMACRINGTEEDEIEQLISALPKNVMEKVAGVSEAAWDMGRAVSNSNFTGNGQTDCVTEWLTRG